MIRIYKLPRNTGTSLVEVIVSVGLFATVMIIGAGALANMSKAHRQARALRSAVENMSLALESMSREIRFGTTFWCGGTLFTTPFAADCPVTSSGGGNEVLSFRNAYNVVVVYKKENEYVGRYDLSCSGFCELSSTREVAIDNIRFYVSGSAGTDTLQPLITIVLKGHTLQGVSVPLSLQTTVVARAR